MSRAADARDSRAFQFPRLIDMKITDFLAMSKNLGMLASQKPDMHVKAIPSGILGIDLASGIGGFPKGRIIDIHGHESVGKTTVTLHAIAERHKAGEYAAFIDNEHTYDPEYARKLGVKDDLLLIHQPSTLNESLDAIKKYCEIDEISLIILDSIAMSATRQQIEAKAGDANISSKAKLLSDQLPAIEAMCSVNGKTLILLNSYRNKPGVVYGDPRYLPGGEAIPVGASMRIELSRRKPGQSNAGTDSNMVWAYFIKNKCAVPFKRTTFEIIYGKGVDNTRTLFDAALHYGLIKRSGNTYTIDDKPLATGKDNAYEALKRNEEVKQELEAKVRAIVKEQGYTIEVEK